MNIVHKIEQDFFSNVRLRFRMIYIVLYCIFQYFSQPVERTNPAIFLCYFYTERQLHLWKLLVESTDFRFSKTLRTNYLLYVQCISTEPDRRLINTIHFYSEFPPSQSILAKYLLFLCKSHY